MVPVQQRKGNELLQLSVEMALKHYQDGMRGVNHGNQYREIRARFASKSYYKKWYKRVFFGICDFMIPNSLFAWNISTSDVPQWRMVKKDNFYAAVAQQLIDYQVT